MMKIKSIVLLSMISILQPVCSSSDTFNGFASSKRIDFQHIYNSDPDDFEIDFETLDRELASLNIEEKKPQNSWWITKQVKRLGTKIMIKALLGYIAFQEFCSEKWQGITKRVRTLVALYYASKTKNNLNESKKF